MPRSKTANDDGPRVDPKHQERADLLAYHMTVLTAGQLAVEREKTNVDEAKAILSEVQSDLTDKFHLAKADTRLDRKVLERALLALKNGARSLIHEREEWDFVCEALGIAYQPDMFRNPATPEAARDEMEWEADGYLSGRRATEFKPPEGCPPMFDQAWRRGYHRGQGANAEQLARAKSIIEERDRPSVEPAVDLTDPDNEADLDDAARALKRSGFMETGGPDAAAGVDAEGAHAADAAA